jgi:DNA mismatch repair ATPase MutS
METTAKHISMVDNEFKAYTEFKAKYAGAMILVRTADGYCTYREDARVLNKVCGAAITQRNGIDYASFTNYYLDMYLPMLVRHGARIAIVEKGQTTAEGKRIMERFC